MENVITIDNVEWSFSNKCFVDFFTELEKITTWRYSGESELILIENNNCSLDFSKTLIFKLDEMLKDGTISSVSNFITTLSNAYKSGENIKAKYFRSNVRKVFDAFVDGVIGYLLKNLAKPVKSGKHFINKDISKNQG